MIIEEFYRLSAALTGYDEVDLLGTGVGDQYYDVLINLIPRQHLENLATQFNLITDSCQTTWDSQIRQQLLSNPLFGPVCRNIIKMWYLSNWYPMPTQWRTEYGVPTQTSHKYDDVEFVISDEAYQEGLVWDAIGAHPMGAKQPGYATWSFQPDDLTPYK